MSKARPSHLGESWRVAIRCSERRYMLTPRQPVVGAVEYCLTIAAERYGIMIHSVSCLSNHIHVDFTDPFGLQWMFRRDFKSLLARSLNCHHCRWEAMFVEDSLQEVRSEEAALRGMVYTILNVVEARLVATPRAWPGLATRLSDLGATEETCWSKVVHKPSFYFRHEEDGGLPETAVLRLVPHPRAEDPEVFVEKVKARVREGIAEARSGSFVGRKAVLAREWWESPDTPERRRELNPRFAEPDPERRIARLLCYKAWWAEYAQAREKWLETGVATFPPGTTKLSTYPGVTVRDGPWPL